MVRGSMMPILFGCLLLPLNARGQPTAHLDHGGSHESWVRHTRTDDAEHHFVWYRHINAGVIPGAREGEVRAGRWTGTEYSREDVDAWLAFSAKPDLAVRDDGTRGIAYSRDPLGPAQHPLLRGVVFREAMPGGAWGPIDLVSEPVENPFEMQATFPVVVAYGDDASPRVGYYDRNQARYQVRVRNSFNGGWNKVADFMGQPGLPCGHSWNDMVLDGNGTMHVACTAAAINVPNQPVYYYRDTGAPQAIRENAMPAVVGKAYERPSVVRRGDRIGLVAVLRDAIPGGPNDAVLRFTERSPAGV